MSYSDIQIPPEKRPEDYSYHERRAEIFEMIVNAGHPDKLSRTELGNYYGVAPSTITRDIEKIKNELKDEVSNDAHLITETFYRKAIRHKVDEEKYMEANRLIKDWNEWLFDIGKQQRVDHDAEDTVDLAEQWTQNLEQDDGIEAPTEDTDGSESESDRERDAEDVAPTLNAED